MTLKEKIKTKIWGFIFDLMFKNSSVLSGYEVAVGGGGLNLGGESTITIKPLKKNRIVQGCVFVGNVEAMEKAA